MSEQVESTRFTIEALQEMVLPTVPDDLSHLLSIEWKSRRGVEINSAVGALSDKDGNPLVSIKLLWKKYLHEEDLPYKDILKESKIFIDMAKESLCLQENDQTVSIL